MKTNSSGFEFHRIFVARLLIGMAVTTEYASFPRTVFAQQQPPREITWTNAATDGDWFNPANWEPMVVPGAGDVVVLASSNLEIPERAAFESVRVDGGSLGGALPEGRVIHWGSGSLGELLQIPTGGRLNIVGPEEKRFSGSLINEGTITWDGQGEIRIFPGSTFENRGVFEIEGDNLLTEVFGGETTHLNNTGIIRKSAGPGTATLGTGGNGFIQINNQGAIEVASGILEIGDHFENLGTVAVAENAEFRMENGLFTLDSSGDLGGPGFYGVTGSVQLKGEIKSDRFQFAQTGGGSIDVDATITGTVNWGPESPPVISGNLTVAPGGTLKLLGPDEKRFGGLLDNRGTIDWDGASEIRFVVGSTIENSGLIDMRGDNLVTGLFGGETIHLNNTGTIRKSGGAGTAIIGSGGNGFVEISNQGLVEIVSGNLEIGDHFENRGKVTVAEGTAFRMGSGVFTLDPVGTIEGAGFYGATGNVQLKGQINSQRFQFASASLTVDATIAGSVDWTVDGTLEGELTVTEGGVLNIDGPADNRLSGKLENRGTVIRHGTGELILHDQTEIVNHGLLEMGGASVFATLFSNDSARLVNQGTWRKSGSDGSTLVRLGPALSNQGRIEILSGEVVFETPMEQESGEFKLRGAVVGFQSGFLLKGGLLSGTGTLKGDVQNHAAIRPGDPFGILNLEGNYTQSESGSLEIGLAGVSPGSQISQLIVNGAAELDGELAIQLAAGLTPVSGQRFELMPYASHSGTFSIVNGLESLAGLSPRLEYDGAALHLTLPAKLTIEAASDGSFQIRFQGEAGLVYALEASNDLERWEVLPLLNQLPGLIDFTDSQSASLNWRFYRVTLP